MKLSEEIREKIQMLEKFKKNSNKSFKLYTCGKKYELSHILLAVQKLELEKENVFNYLIEHCIDYCFHCPAPKVLCDDLSCIRKLVDFLEEALGKSWNQIQEDYYNA